MKFVTSYSFGKDSALAMHRMVQAGHEPVALLTTFNATHGRNWFHGIQPDLMQAVANSMNLPLILCACGDDDYNQGLEDGLRKAKAMGAEACVFGDIDIEGHAAYDQARCDAVGLQCVLPLWQEGRTALLEECLSAGFLPMIKTVRSDLLADTFLGQTLTMPLARRMEQTGADICGENGEYHTFVYDGPLFSAPVAVQAGDIVDLGTHKTIDIQLTRNH